MEMIVVIVITGILAGIVAVFIRGPIDSYFDMARRADLSDVADTALRRMARDLRRSLANTPRNPADGSDQCIEFMPVKTGARYRADQTAASTGDILDFTTADVSFDMLGTNATLPASDRLAVGDIVVVYNDGSTSGNAYAGTNAVQIANVSVGDGDTANTTKITFVGAVGSIFAAKTFPSASPANRFQVLAAAEQVVAYRCTTDGNLFRYSRTIAAAAWARPANCSDMVVGATQATLAANVGACSIVYQPPGTGSVTGRQGLVSISLTLTQGGEAVSLYQQVHLDSAP